ncbi:MAG: hypothetical protein K2X87_30045 [Gemmataceae bacterium]|nr:hypothetical protein [Gemmataceae bacterium]
MSLHPDGAGRQAESPPDPAPPSDPWPAVRAGGNERHRPWQPEMPGPQGHNIGLDPRYRGYLRRNEPVTFGQLRARVANLREETAGALRQLANRDATNEGLIAAVAEKLEGLMAGFAEAVEQVEALIARANDLNTRLAQVEALASRLDARVAELEAGAVPQARRPAAGRASR